MQLLRQKAAGSTTVLEFIHHQRLDYAPQNQQIVSAFGFNMIQMQVDQVEQSPKGGLLLDMRQYKVTYLVQTCWRANTLNTCG